ncbi:hypothetical protein I79_026157 [Cricetulus griseus]|uniref:Uncharacterized protein n=1 Tax=Cricetulus griseus TaxID=10029 RepID=G3IQ63_CRIGR|nr:hypothetical protein I79_026157 [Cricetulus griseus]
MQHIQSPSLSSLRWSPGNFWCLYKWRIGSKDSLGVRTCAQCAVWMRANELTVL